MYKWYNHAEVTPWDNDVVVDDVVDNVVDDTNDDDADDTPVVGTKGKDGKLFSQEDVDRMIAKRNKKVNAELQQAKEAYESLLEQTNLTQKQRDDFEERLQNIRKQMMSKEELLKEEQKKAAEAHSVALKEVEERANKYQRLFEQNEINRAIVDAAMTEDGFSGDQFIAFLGPKSRMVDEIDRNNQPTGRLVPRIEWEVTDEDGKIDTVLMAPAEVVKLMKEQDKKYGNMFNSNVSKGIGGGTSPSEGVRSGKIDPKTVSTKEFMEIAKTKEGRQALGLER